MIVLLVGVVGCGEDEEMSYSDYRGIYDNVPTSRNTTGPIPVTPVEARRGPWTGNPNLGQFIQFAPTLGNRTSILKMGEWGMPSVRTVTLGIEVVDESIDSSFAMVAEVIVGAGGTTKTFEMDWKNGTSFTLPMNAIEVVAKPHPDSDVGPLENIRLAAWIGEGSRVNRRPTYTVLLKDFGTGLPLIPTGSSSQRITIPNFATAVRFNDVNTPNTMFNAGNSAFFMPASVGLVAVKAVHTNMFTPAQAYVVFSYDGIDINEFSRYMFFANVCGSDVQGWAEFELDL
jgi:hypothetical protein